MTASLRVQQRRNALRASAAGNSSKAARSVWWNKSAMPCGSMTASLLSTSMPAAMPRHRATHMTLPEWEMLKSMPQPGNAGLPQWLATNSADTAAKPNSRDRRERTIALPTIWRTASMRLWKRWARANSPTVTQGIADVHQLSACSFMSISKQANSAPARGSGSDGKAGGGKNGLAVDKLGGINNIYQQVCICCIIAPRFIGGEENSIAAFPPIAQSYRDRFAEHSTCCAY